MHQDPLSEKLASLNSTKSHSDGDSQRWNDDVSQLFQLAREWLADDEKSKSLWFQDQHAPQRQDDGSTRMGRQLAIQLTSGPLILLVPRDRRIVGALAKHDDLASRSDGRVDMINFQDRRALGIYRAKVGAWMLPTPSGHEVWAPLDRDGFRAALASLL